MKAGKYYVGDLCYVIDSSHWEEFIEISNSSKDVEKQFEEFEFVMFDTEIGDGSYSSNIKKEFPVDSGTIGCIPVEYLEKYNPDLVKTEKQFIFHFKSDFDCEELNGVIHIGHISIDTSTEDFEEDSDIEYDEGNDDNFNEDDY